MTDGPRYRYWGDRKPVLLARPAETVSMAAGKTAQIRLYGPIDSWGAPFGVAASEVADALEQAGPDTPVEMHVHSPGGDAFEGLAIMNQLRQHKGPVSIVVDGLAASAASIVAMGADTVTMVPGSQIMIHDASALAIGQADDMRQAADMLDSISSNAADQYAAKAGKPADDMRAAMKATTWYKAQEAVDAGLADAVLAPETEQAKAAQTAAASLRFDLSIYPNAPVMVQTIADKVAVTPEMTGDPKTPADQPVNPPTQEDSAMPETIPTAGLAKVLDLPVGADEDAILDAVDALKVKATAEPKPALDLGSVVASLDPKDIAAALKEDGKVVVSENVLAELTAQAQAGAQARAKQLEEERDATIAQAFTDGKISADRRDAWKASWDKDPDGTKADLESLPARFPVGKPKGHQGDPDLQSTDVVSDDEAGVLAHLTGAPKEAFLA